MIMELIGTERMEWKIIRIWNSIELKETDSQGPK
jgi:hypothetical protein